MKYKTSKVFVIKNAKKCYLVKSDKHQKKQKRKTFFLFRLKFDVFANLMLATLLIS
jgi:hypothetical protein